MKLNIETLQEVKKWIYRNARLIEISLWEFYFENGSVDQVLKALEFYQNADGGFGHALEADNWNPNSSPYATLNAINILKNIEFNDINHPIYVGIINYIESSLYDEDGYWMFSIPSNDLYPHAPWWTYHQEANKVESIGLTAELTAFILEYSNQGSNLHKKALDIAKEIITRLIKMDKHGDMGIGGYIILVDKLRSLNIAGFDYERIQNRLNELVRDSIEYDVSKWKQYGVRPSNYITTPESKYYIENKDIVEKELDYLIETRPEGGVWDITWTWFENNEKYAKEFAISENWWKSCKAIEKLVFLDNFNRINRV
jgi:hypothetical protein